MSISLTPMVTWNGLLAIFTTNAGTNASITAINPATPPLIFVNGTQGALGQATWLNSDKSLCFVTYQVTSPATILNTDVVTYTIPAGTITTAAGSNLAVSSPAAVLNSIGQLEPGIGIVNPAPTKTMRLGVNLGSDGFNRTAPWCATMNLRYRMTFVQNAATTLVFNSSDPSLPQSWTSSGSISAALFQFQNSNFIETASGQVGYPVPQGQYIFSWDDANASTSAQAVLVLTGNTNVCTGVDTTFTSGIGQVSVVGSRVTVTYPAVAYTSKPNLTHGYNMNLTVSVKSTVGLWAQNNTITNFIAVGPGDTVAQVLANPLALPNWLVAALTAINSNGPAYIRAIDSTANGGYGNYQNYADCPNINAFSWGVLPNPTTIPFTSARFYNTNPALDNVVGNGTYPWAASTKVYDPLLGFDGTDAYGPYLDLSARPALGGETDYGAYTVPPGGSVPLYSSLELVASTPHGLRTGDCVTSGNYLQSFPLTGTVIFPCTGGVTTSLPTVQVSNGSQTITFNSAPSPALPANTGLVFGSDSSGLAYWTQGAGTAGQTVYTIISGYQGTNSLSSTCNISPTVNLNNITGLVVHATGPETVALSCGFTTGITTGSGTQKLAGTAQIPITFALSSVSYGKGNFGPYGFWAAAASNWPGCSLVVPLQPLMTVACLQAVADEIAVNSLPNATILFELGDEHWNFPGFKVGLLTAAYGRLLAYVAAGQAVNPYYTSPGTPIAISNDAAYTLILAHQHDIIQAQFNTHNKGLTVGRLFGGFWNGSGVATNMVTFASAHGISMGYVGVAPYYGTPSAANTTWAQACQAASGNWPAPLIHDFYRLNAIYNTGIWGLFSTNYTALQAYSGPACAGQTNGKPSLFGYENQINTIDPNGISALEHDLFYSKQMAQTFPAHLYSIQVGSPLVPGSGLVGSCIYTALGGWAGSANPTALWCVFIYMQQPTGDGSTNVFTTAQGDPLGVGNGLCNDMTFTGGVQTGNVSVEAVQMLAWFSAANTPPAPPPPPPPGPGTYQASPVTGGMLTFGLVLGGLIQFGPFSLFADYADPRQGTILYPDNDPAGVDPRQGFVVFTSSDPFGVDPRQGSILDPDTDPLGVDPRQGSVIN